MPRPCALSVSQNDSAEDALWGWLSIYFDDDRRQKIMLVLRFLITGYVRLSHAMPPLLANAQ